MQAAPQLVRGKYPPSLPRVPLTVSCSSRSRSPRMRLQREYMRWQGALVLPHEQPVNAAPLEMMCAELLVAGLSEQIQMQTMTLGEMLPLILTATNNLEPRD